MRAAVLAALFFAPAVLSAQSTKVRNSGANETGPFPNDSTTVVRALPNGLTYYIKSNREPAGSVELRLVVKAGSTNERDDQVGAAHVLARSAAFGTKRFPYDSLKSYLRNAAAGVGGDSTIEVGYDVTVYRLTVRQDSSAVNTALSLLSDWTSGWTLTDAIVDSARHAARDKVFSAEERQPKAEAFTDSIRFADTPLGKHRPLGTAAAIDVITKGQLQQFQRDWYRPDNMAIVVVGDVQVADADALIKRHFGSIATVPGKLGHATPTYGIPGTTGTSIAVFNDSDSLNTWIQVMYRKPSPPRGSMETYRWSILNSVFTNIISQRVGELRGQPNSVITRANASLFSDGPDGTMVVFRAGVQGASADSALSALVNEIATVAQHGFTKEEFVLWQQMLGKTYNNPNIQLPPDPSAALAAQYIRHFAVGAHFATQAQQRPLVGNVLNTMTMEELQAHAKSWLTAPSKVIVVGVGRSGGSAPSKASLTSIFEANSQRKAAQRRIDSTFRIVEIKADSVADLSLLIKKEVGKAVALGYTPVVEFGATWCIPCRLVDVSMHHPKMRDAFDEVYLIRIDVDEWPTGIPAAGFQVNALPVFYAVNRNGRPTGTRKEGTESGQMNPSTGDMNNSFVEASAPGFKTFFEKCKKEFAETQAAQ